MREAAAVHAGAEEDDAAVALSVRGLQKIFDGKRPCFCGLCGKKKPAFHAVKVSCLHSLEDMNLPCGVGVILCFCPGPCA